MPILTELSSLREEALALAGDFVLDLKRDRREGLLKVPQRSELGFRQLAGQLNLGRC